MSHHDEVLPPVVTTVDTCSSNQYDDTSCYAPNDSRVIMPTHMPAHTLPHPCTHTLPPVATPYSGVRSTYIFTHPVDVCRRLCQNCHSPRSTCTVSPATHLFRSNPDVVTDNLPVTCTDRLAHGTDSNGNLTMPKGTDRMARVLGLINLTRNTTRYENTDGLTSDPTVSSTRKV
jgi:hypothetical protein